jgi:FkbM family methyltransferase
MSVDRATLDTAFNCLENSGFNREALASGCIVDAGANIGTTSITAIARGLVARAVCIEPLRDNQTLLKRNAELNDVSGRIRQFEFALSDHVGEVQFELPDVNWGDGRVRVRGGGSPGWQKFDEDKRHVVVVPTKTLDALVKLGDLNLNEISVLWLDAQGHEGHILSGASSLLATQIPVVTEFWPYGLQRANGLARYFAAVEGSFSSFIDLGKVRDPKSPDRRPVKDVRQLVQHYPGASFTDLLLLS